MFRFVLSPAPYTYGEIVGMALGSAFCATFLGLSVAAIIYFQKKQSDTGGDQERVHPDNRFNARYQPHRDDPDSEAQDPIVVEETGPTFFSDIYVYPSGKKKTFEDGNIIKEYAQVKAYRLISKTVVQQPQPEHHEEDKEEANNEEQENNQEEEEAEAMKEESKEEVKEERT